MAWYFPQTQLCYGKENTQSGPAFGAAPSTGTAANQQAVTGFMGHRLVNTYDPSSDGLTGTLTSPEFTTDKGLYPLFNRRRQSSGKNVYQFTDRWEDCPDLYRSKSGDP